MGRTVEAFWSVQALAVAPEFPAVNKQEHNTREDQLLKKGFA